MVNPARISRRLLLAAACAGALASAGCGFIPQGRLDECHKMSRTLQAENSRLRDKFLTLQSQNQELTLRGLDDARQLRASEEVIAQQEQSINEYQKEREATDKAVARLKRAVEQQATATVRADVPGP
jgi:chemotaxis protein MotB